MTNILQIPESLQFYFENAQQAGAIQQILEMDSLPLGLTWEEIEHYSMAKLSAQTTQLDYWLFSKKLWESTWGQEERFIKNYQEVEPEWYENENTVDNVWEEDTFYKAFYYKDDNIIFFHVSIYPEEGSLLSFYIRSPEDTYETSNNLNLSENWHASEDDERRIKKGLDICGKKEIDIYPLIESAKEVLNALGI